MSDVVDASNSPEFPAGGAAAAGKGDGSAGPCPPSQPPPDLAVPVTRQVRISGPDTWKHVLSGIDTLDLGFYVEWGDAWPELERWLRLGKMKAERTEGVRLMHRCGKSFVVLPRGKPPMYAYHLQVEDGHLFIGSKPAAPKHPNVYVSVSARTLWGHGPNEAIRRWRLVIDALGGQIDRVQISRCDFCADFMLEKPLLLDFVREFRVSRADCVKHFCDGDRMESYYCGGASSDIQLRMYDKGLEVLKAGEKLWFFDLWDVPQDRHVWRVEFQLRRECLRQFRVNSYEDLVKHAGGIWSYLADEWFSLREPDNANATRRSVHPWWLAVQGAAVDFGSELPARRQKIGDSPADVSWYISHAAGCIVGYAARLGLSELAVAGGNLLAAMLDYWTGRNFPERYDVERVKLGLPMQTPGVVP